MTDQEVLDEKTRTLRGIVEFFDFFLCQFEIPDVIVFLNSVLISGFRDNSNSLLYQVTEEDLGWSLVVFLCQCCNMTIFEGSRGGSPVWTAKKAKLSKKELKQ